MRTCLITLFSVVLGCVLMALGAQASEMKIAVVDVARLMRDSEPGKAGMKFIETQQTELQGKLDAIQDRLEKNPEDQEAMRELQQVYATSQQRIQAEGQNVAGQVFDIITRVLNRYRAENGYTAIIGAEAMASFDPAIDVTDALLIEINKEKFDFKPAPVPESSQTAPVTREPVQDAKAIQPAPNADKEKSGK